MKAKLSKKCCQKHFRMASIAFEGVTYIFSGKHVPKSRY